MNHENAHCLEFRKDCPQECRRAQMSRDLENQNMAGTWVSYASFIGTDECPKRKEKNES